MGPAQWPVPIKPPEEQMTAITPAHPLTSRLVTTEGQLRALIGEPAALTCAKISDRLDAMTRLFY
ncbi:hypothetical protein WKW77_04005 [Variovorax ureilyticus]|uniref:Uncharacterized protein n=1 Tax=Variovorax ureilyticus TaxID=1836198 RepID=A0ABU8V991_9BURK